jgi:hypothetical protein
MLMTAMTAQISAMRITWLVLTDLVLVITEGDFSVLEPA